MSGGGVHVPEHITIEVRALTGMGLQELREQWRRRYGPPPKLRSPDFLRRLLAYRIQAAAVGGLTPETKRRLRGKARAGPILSPGAKVSREWAGRLHEVEVTAGDRFLYAGQSFASLSAVALKITGVSWNGPRFFGLRAGRPD